MFIEWDIRILVGYKVTYWTGKKCCMSSVTEKYTDFRFSDCIDMTMSSNEHSDDNRI